MDEAEETIPKQQGVLKRQSIKIMAPLHLYHPHPHLQNLHAEMYYFVPFIHTRYT